MSERCGKFEISGRDHPAGAGISIVYDQPFGPETPEFPFLSQRDLRDLRYLIDEKLRDESASDSP